ncbi:MAG: hypothetical protein ABIZ50_01775, partial [Solirubrobacterales bacterium]
MAIAAATVAIAGCGSDSGGGPSGEGRPASAVTRFPPPNGQTTEELVAEIGVTNDIVVSPAGQTYEEGENRVSFGVFNVDRSQISDAEVAIYAAPGSDGVAEGPFPARIESLATDPAFEAETTASDPDAAAAAYVSDVSFDRPGEWRLIAVVKRDNQMLASRLPSIDVGPYPKIPDVGERAPRIHTPTV